MYTDNWIGTLKMEISFVQAYAIIINNTSSNYAILLVGRLIFNYLHYSNDYLVLMVTLVIEIKRYIVLGYFKRLKLAKLLS